ncbi:MAG: TadE/TadG family type IV pilus assembly protein [Sphingomicrobium sp.]
MIRFMKQLWNDRRGNAIIIAAVTLPVVVGAAGLGTDTVQWVGWKRQLQRAADSAAIAGVYGRAQSQDVNTAVGTDLDKNNHLWVPLLGGYPQVTTPADTSSMTYTTKVDLAVRQKLGFSSLFLATPPTITVSATAAMIPDGNYCVVALQPGTDPGIYIGGSSNVHMGCGAISNSLSATDSVKVMGGAHTFVADPVAAVGGISSTINGAGELQPFHVAMPDPYAGKFSTDIPAGETCTNFNHANKTNADGSKKPGCYNNFTAGLGTVLSPGTYYLNNTDIKLTGHDSVTGDGVTIILTGSSPGSVDMSGNSSLDLTAPTTGPYANMVLIQAPNAATGNNNTINGDNGTSLDGAIYFPQGDLTFTGSSAAATQCAMIVSYTVAFSGNASVQNDTSSCTADTQVQGKKVRLIA